MDFLTFLSIVLPAVLNSWPLVVLILLFRFGNTVQEKIRRIEHVTWKHLSIVFWNQDLPQLPPLRELSVIDTVALGGTCRTSARLLGATLSLQMGGHATGSAGCSATLA